MSTTAVLGPPRGMPHANDDEALFETINGERVELPPMSVYATMVANLLARA